LCNREIKFDIFLETALNLGADYIATGHYCQKDQIEKDGNIIYRLLAGKDKNKDQSYFLCQLNQYQLSKALFPIGGLLKPEVREIAKHLDLITAEKKDSQGLCFVGKVRLPDFLMQKLKPKKGSIVEIPNNSPIFESRHHQAGITGNLKNSLELISEAYHYTPDDGKVVGQHQGAHYFTIGQRKGLGVGGTPEPLFIIDTDTKNNIVYTGQGDQHNGLYRKGLFVRNEDIHWIRDDLRLHSDSEMHCEARIRYRQDLEKAVIYQRSNGLYVIFDKLQRGITPGQFVAWYLEDELLGSGIIY